MYTYEEAVEYIEEIPKFTKKNKLEHTKECLNRLGSPDREQKIIHVAGTNGKGSVCAFLSSMLGEGGYRVGLFTSPHLIKINERFQINEVPIGDDEFLQAFLKVKQLSDKLVEEGNYHPTYFEFLFLMGMLVFQEAEVDYIVLETGLGGRMDATNSIEKPLACVITSIGLDHVEYLGTTISAIASEKAGILKPSVPVIYDGNQEEAAAVIKSQAVKLHCPAAQVVQQRSKMKQITPDGIQFSFQCRNYGTIELSIPFIAGYQVMNASLAIETMGILERIHKIPKETVIAGLGHTRWQGRMETIMPGVIVDGAHNEDGVKKFVETARYFQEDYEIHLLFSAVGDKDYKDMIRTICSVLQFNSVVTTQIMGSRVVSAKELAEIFHKNGCRNSIAIPDVGQAFEEAYRQKKKGMLFCVGSLYLVGEIKDYIRRKVHD